MRTIMNNASLAGKTFTGTAKFPTGMTGKPDVCVYQVDEHGNASINAEDKEAAEAAGFKDGEVVPKEPPPVPTEDN